jgi:hypothetical protein
MALADYAACGFRVPTEDVQQGLTTPADKRSGSAGPDGFCRLSMSSCTSRAALAAFLAHVRLMSWMRLASMADISWRKQRIFGPARLLPTVGIPRNLRHGVKSSAKDLLMSVGKTSVTTFLNVDLDIRARAGLGELLNSMASSAILLQKTELDASLELNENFTSLEEALTKLMELIVALPPLARDIWHQCEFRRFNIGIQAGNEPHAALFAISSKTVSLLAEAQVELIFTVYALAS